MSGIEKMTEQILADAFAQAQEILDCAKKEAEEERQKANLIEESKIEKAALALEKEARVMEERAQSSRDLTRRRARLEKKQEIIANFMNRALEKMKNADDKEYFSMIYQMLEKVIREGEASMYLSEKDLLRKPSDFEEQVSAIANKVNATIHIMNQGKDIKDGFLLVYGGTQENCSFESFMETEKNRLQDEVNHMLWGNSNG